MAIRQNNNEKLILEAAEAEFLEKGYGKARTTEIAKRAGVNHAMLHYYFRTKEHLFEVVFQKKANLMADLILFAFRQELPFLERVKKGIEDHFDFIAMNRQLPTFIFSEIQHNKELKKIFIAAVREKALLVFDSLKKEIDEEVQKGTIRYIEPVDLLLTMLSLNCFVFISAPVLSEIVPVDLTRFLEQRKRLNVEIIINQLKI